MQVRVDPDAFMELGRRIMNYPQRGGRDMELRRFKSHFGTTNIRCCTLWRMLINHGQARQILSGARPRHLLWALLFLKTYQTEALLCAKTGCDEKTLRKWCWKFVHSLSLLETRVIRFDRRLRGAVGRHHLMSVDGTDCRINEPKPFDRKWYSHKFRAAGVRYEVALSLRRSEIVWINGPFPCGRFPDITIFRNGLKHRLRRGERVLADRGYRGDESCNIPNPNDNADVSKLKADLRARHETVNARLKSFSILNTKFRHDLNKHAKVFRAVVVITQVNLQDEPLFNVQVPI